MPTGIPPVTTHPLLTAIEALVPLVQPTAVDRILRAAVAQLGAAVGGQAQATAAPLALAAPAPAPVTARPKAKGRPTGAAVPGRGLSPEALTFLRSGSRSKLARDIGCSTQAIDKWRATGRASAAMADAVEAAAAAAPAAVAVSPDLDDELRSAVAAAMRASGLSPHEAAARAGVEAGALSAFLSGAPLPPDAVEPIFAWATA